MLLGLQSVKQVSLLCLDKMLSLLLIHHHYADGLAPCGSLTQWVVETQKQPTINTMVKEGTHCS